MFSHFPASWCSSFPSILPPTCAHFLQEFHGDGVRGDGVLYPSPASRFGARDGGSSRMACSSLDTTGPGYHPNDSQPTYCSPYFAHLDQQDNESLREGRQPRRLALEEENGEYKARGHGFDSESSTEYLSATSYGHGGTGGVIVEGDTLAGQQRGSCGYLGGLEAQVSIVRSEATDPLPPQRQPPLRSVNGAQNANRRSRTELEECHDLPGVSQERSGEDINRGEPSGVDAVRLSRLFAYAFPDTYRLSATSKKNTKGRSDSLGGGGCGMASRHPRRPKAQGANHGSRPDPSSSPRLLPRSGTVAATTNMKTLVGVSVRRPPSPQFSFMAEDYSPNADARSAVSSTQRAPVEAQEQEVQGASCVNKPFRAPCEGLANIHHAWAPVVEKSGSPQRVKAPHLPEDEGLGCIETVGTPSRSRKRKRPVTRGDVAPRGWPSPREDAVRHRPSSAGGRDDDSRGEEDGCWLGWTHGLVHAQGGDAPRCAGDEEAVDELRLFQVDEAAAAAGDCFTSCRGQNRKIDSMAVKNIGESRGTEEAPYERATARDVMQDFQKATAVANDGDFSQVEDNAKKDSALAYDLGMIVDHGLAEAGFGNVELETVAGVLGKFKVDR